MNTEGDKTLEDPEETSEVVKHSKFSKLQAENAKLRARLEGASAIFLDGNWPAREEAACFGLFKIRRIGNIYVLAEWCRSDGKKRRICVGPYWHFLIFTLFIIGAVTYMIYAWVIPPEDKVERIIGLALSILAILSFLCTALSDPGIYPRFSKPLLKNWTYSEFAQSYRPPGVIFCQQCQVLIEDYNHFCPWSGTVIGRGNEPYFQVFICSMVVSLVYDLIVTGLALHNIDFWTSV